MPEFPATAAVGDLAVTTDAVRVLQVDKNLNPVKVFNYEDLNPELKGVYCVRVAF